MIWISILAGDVRERADKSAVAAINRALRFTRKDVNPGYPQRAGADLWCACPQALYSILCNAGLCLVLADDRAD